MFLLPQQLKLQRYPKTSDKSLRAWNAADELLLDHLQQVYSPTAVKSDAAKHHPRNTLIINDQFGALSVGLNHFAPYYWTDSYLSEQAILRNLQVNIDNSVLARPLSVEWNNQPDYELNFNLSTNITFDLLVIRIPKHLSMLQFQLQQIKSWLSSDVKIVAGGMTKEIHNSTLNIFESCFGATTSSLATKKARLVHSELTNFKSQPLQLSHYHLASEGLDIFGLPGVFSREKLDIGTRVLLEYLPELHPGEKAIDLGCGCGVIGAILAKRQPNSEILLSDESAMAIASAKLTFSRNHLSNGVYLHTDVLHQVSNNQYKHILCNPPFHQQNVQTLAIAQKMFKHSAEKLTQCGELRVVANRHLNYLPMLKRYFAKVKSISADSKFTVWLATSPKK